MNIFGWRKNLPISSQNPVFKVRYLGNVQTSVMKGEGCVDRATNIIWSNHKKHDQNGIEMKIELTGSGMKAFTQDQGLTEYLASRISYCIAHPKYPRLFVWVYRHEGRKSKMELRCHAVLCKNESKAKAIAFQLCEKLKSALEEFKREKLHLQNSRLVLQKTNSVPKSGNLLPLRTQLLSTAKNFRPPPTRSNSASKLGAIREDKEEPLGECIEEEGEEEEEEEEDETIQKRPGKLNELRGHILTSASHAPHTPHASSSEPPSPSSSAGPAPPRLLHKGREHHDILEALDLENATGSNSLVEEEEEEEEGFARDDVIDLEFGNDFKELEQEGGGVQYCIHNEAVDSDEESAESGFHDQEASFPESELADGGDSDSASSSEDKKIVGKGKAGNRVGDSSSSSSMNDNSGSCINGSKKNDDDDDVNDEDVVVCTSPLPVLDDNGEEEKLSFVMEKTAL